MARPILNKKTVNGKLTYYVNGTAYTNKDKARSAVNKAYESGADAETKKAKEMRKLIEEQLKLDKPKKPTAKELEAQSIEKIRKGEGTLIDSLTAKIVPKDVQQSKIDAKPKKGKTVSQKIADIDNILNLELTENERAKYESQRSVLVKELMKQYGGSQDSTSTDNYNAPEPKKKIGRRERTRIFQAKVKAIQEKIESGELGKIPKKYLMNGNRAGYMWAKDLAKIEMETPADPLGLRK